MDLQHDLELVAERRGRRVASYQTLSGAALAVERLRQHGYGPGVSVHPDDIRPIAVSPVPEESARWTRRRRFVALASFVAVAVGLIQLGIAFVIAVAAALGLVAGSSLLASWSDARRRRRAERAASLVRAQRFEVCCERRSDEADHLLATWWDPHAPVAVRSMSNSRSN